MDHDLVVRQQMTEKYLLGELEPGARLEFEEHFFDCSECALDVRAGDLFVQQAKGVLAEDSVPVSSKVPATALVPAAAGWLAWLRPAFAVPALVLLLAVIGYQNLVTYPQLRQARVLPFASVNVGTWGSAEQTISIRRGEGFLLFVRIPPDGYSSHVAELYNPAGKPEWSVTIPSTSTQDQWPVQVPGANRETGSYLLVVRGLTSTGDSEEVGRASFELQIQK
jgi:anti-sigma factor RsiW